MHPSAIHMKMYAKVTGSLEKLGSFMFVVLTVYNPCGIQVTPCGVLMAKECLVA